jgi:hypothetical protein
MKPSGTLIRHPDAWRLVQMGVAEPADDECDAKAGMTANDQIRARHAYERLSLGIHPEDFAAFDAGHMRGYNRDGSWIPGPNYAEYKLAQWENE